MCRQRREKAQIFGLFAVFMAKNAEKNTEHVEIAQIFKP